MNSQSAAKVRFYSKFQVNHMHSHAQIKTNDGRRISKRLMNHWKHKFEVAETQTTFKIFMPDATVNLSPYDDMLYVDIHSELNDPSHLEQIVIDHINRMAQAEFHVEWIHKS